MRANRYLLVTVMLKLSLLTLAQEKKTFETEANKILEEVKKWEAKPDSIVKIEAKSRFKGRKVIVKTTWLQKGSSPYFTRYNSKSKIWLTTSGIVEQFRIYQNGNAVPFLSMTKINERILAIFLRTGLEEKTFLADKYITIYGKSRKPQTKEYYHRDN